MHEIGMCESVLAAVERRAGGRAVEAVRIRVGTMLRVVPEAFAQGFEMVAVGTVAEGATTELVVVPVHATCTMCQHTFEVDDPTPLCPGCGSVRVTREGGDELVLESITYRADEPAERK